MSSLYMWLFLMSLKLGTWHVYSTSWLLFWFFQLVYSCKVDKCLLPPKKMFGNQSDTFIKKRQSDLEAYLQTMLYYLAHKVPPVLASFLQFDKYVRLHHVHWTSLLSCTILYTVISVLYINIDQFSLNIFWVLLFP